MKYLETNSTKIIKIFLVLLLVLSLISCKSKKKEEVFEKPKGKIIAQVNNEYLTLENLKSMFTEDEFKDLTLDEKQNLVKNWIDLTAFSEKAKQLKIDEESSIEIQIQMAKKKILANALLAFKNKKFSFKEEDLFKYYKIHKADFVKTSRALKLQTIFIQKEENLAKVRKELREGNKISEVAKKYSLAPSGKNGGYIGWRTKKSYNNKLWNRVSTLAQHKYSIVELNNGYHLVSWYKEKKEEDFKSFSIVKDEIKKILIKEKENESYKKTLKEVKKEFNTAISI